MAATCIIKSMPRLITACFKNALFTFPDPQNIGIDTSFVTFACLVTDISAKHGFSVMAATNLHIYEYCVTLITSEMSQSYSLTLKT